MGGFAAAFLVSFIWVAAVCQAVDSKIPICTKTAPICSSVLYPICVYSEDCNPDWECVPLSNLLLSIFTKFRCFPTPNPGTDTSTVKPYPTVRKSNIGYSDTWAEPNVSGGPLPSDDRSKDAQDTPVRRVEIRAQALSSSQKGSEESIQNGSADDTKHDSDTSPDHDLDHAKPSSLPITPTPHGNKPLDTVEAKPGKIVKDTPVGDTTAPLTPLELDQLFNGATNPKISSFPQNRISLDSNSNKISGPSQHVDWSGVGSIDSLPSGESTSKQFKQTVPEPEPNMRNLKVGTNFANKPNLFANIATADSIGLGNSPTEVKERSLSTDSLKMFGVHTNGKSKPPRKKASGMIMGSILVPNEPGSKVNQGHKIDPSTDPQDISQTKLVRIDEKEGKDLQDDTEDLSKPVTIVIHPKSPESQEINSPQLQYNVPNENRPRLSLDSQVQKTGSFVKPKSELQAAEGSEPSLRPFIRPPSNATVLHSSESLQDSKANGHADLGSSLSETLKNNPTGNQETRDKPKIPTTKDGSSSQKTNESTGEAPSIEGSNEPSNTKPLLQPAQRSSEKPNAKSHKHTEADSKGSPTDQSKLTKTPRSGSLHKSRSKGHGSNKNIKHA